MFRTGFQKTNLKVNQLSIKDVLVANTSLSRLQGLLFTKEQDLTGMLLINCSSVHTMFMRYKIDIVFLDSNNRVVKTVQQVKPYRFCFGTQDTINTLELTAGTIDKERITLGQTLTFSTFTERNTHEKEAI